MSYSETKNRSDTAVVIENDIKPPVQLLINPIQYRSEIFSAVRISHEHEIQNRYVFYDKRRDRSRLPIETSRQYLDYTQSVEIDVTITKTGHRFRVEGNIVDKILCQTYPLLCFLKTTPVKHPSMSSTEGTHPNHAPTSLEFRERLIGLQLQLEEIRKDQLALIAGNSQEQPPTTPLPYHNQGYQESNFTNYSPHTPVYPRPNYPSPYQS